MDEEATSDVSDVSDDPVVAVDQDIQKSCFGAVITFLVFVGATILFVFVLMKAAFTP